MRKITLYIGLNDKITKTQKINTLDAYNVICNILDTGATIQEAKGIYKHDDGTQVIETSLVVELLDFTGDLNRKWLIDKVEAIKEALNQEAVAVQVEDVNSELI